MNRILALVALAAKARPLIVQLFVAARAAWPILAALAALASDYHRGGLAATGLVAVGAAVDMAFGRRRPTARPAATVLADERATIRLAAGVTAPPARDGSDVEWALLSPDAPDEELDGEYTPEQLRYWSEHPDADPDNAAEPPFEVVAEVGPDGRRRRRATACYKHGKDGVGRWVPISSRLYFEDEPGEASASAVAA